MTHAREQLLTQAVKNDSVYRNLLQKCLAVEPDYLRFRSTVSGEDQKILDRYISLCEELDHRRTCLALSLK